MSAPPQFESLDEAARRKVREGSSRVRYLYRGGRGWWLLQRVLVWTILVLAAAGFVRAILAPPVAVLVDQAVEARLDVDPEAWPTDQAQQTAVTQVVWQMEMDGAEVLSATPGLVNIISDTQGTVTVAALVQTVPTVDRWSDDEDEPVSAIDPAAAWRWFEVPVTVDGGRVTVAAPAVDVAGTTPGEPDDTRLPTVDQDLTAETADVVDVIFAAYAGGSRAALDAVTDGTVGLLPEGIELVQVDGWQATSADGGATGIATVTWQTAGDGTSTQPYRVDLERDAEGRWQATGIGAHLPADQE